MFSGAWLNVVSLAVVSSGQREENNESQWKGSEMIFFPLGFSATLQSSLCSPGNISQATHHLLFFTHYDFVPQSQIT